MGLLANAVRALLPATKASSTPVGAIVPTWDSGVPMTNTPNYYRNALDGYMADELVFACVDFRANAAGEPPLCAYRGGEKVDEHPALEVLNNPNPFMGGADLWGTVSMFLDIGGNAYLEKVRDGSGKLIELWPLRPDRMRVIPDSRTFVGGYQYTIAQQTFRLDAADVVHFKTRHPLDDYYGLPPLYVLAGRVDLDVWSRRFTEAFFRNAGIPAGLLNLQRGVTETEREGMRQRFRELYGGAEGWHRLMVLDGGQATYTPMGLPLGGTGAAMPELNRILETRIMGAFGLFPSLIASIVGTEGNRGQTADVSERDKFWEQTMSPWFRRIDSRLWAALQDEFPDLDNLKHDLSAVRALQEDADALHARWREDYFRGLCTWAEARTEIGLPAEPDEPGYVLVPTTMVPTWSDDLLEQQAPPEPVAPSPIPSQAGQMLPSAQPAQNGQANGVAAH